MILRCVHFLWHRKCFPPMNSSDNAQQSTANGLAEVNFSQAAVMLAASISQLSAAIWGLAEAFAEYRFPSADFQSRLNSTAAAEIGVPVKKEVETAKRPRGRPRKRPPEPLFTRSENEPASVPAIPPARRPKVIDYFEVKAAIEAVGKNTRVGGHSVALGILKRFGVDHGQALKPEQYADVVAACAATLASAL
jgi:hypothetical protein